MNSDHMNWAKYEDLVIDTETIVTAVHLELSARLEKPVVLIKDDILVRLTQAACANFDLMRDIEGAMLKKEAGSHRIE